MKAKVRLDEGRWVEADLWWFGHKPDFHQLCVRFSREDAPEGRQWEPVSPDNIVPLDATVRLMRETMTTQDRADLAGWAKYWRKRFVENREAKKRKEAAQRTKQESGPTWQQAWEERHGRGAVSAWD